MLQVSKPPGGFSTPYEAASYLERALSSCRHIAASQGYSFLVYLIGMAVDESRARAQAAPQLPAPLSDDEACRYVDETVRHLVPLMQRPRLRTLAFMLDHVRSEAEEMMRECSSRQIPPVT